MHSLFIVKATVKDWFNEQAIALGNNGPAIGAIQLSKDGLKPGTHGWCAVTLNPEQEAAATELLAANPDKAAQINWTRYDLNTDPGWPQKQLVFSDLKVRLLEPAWAHPEP